MKIFSSGKTLTAILLAVMMLAGGMTGVLAEGTEAAAPAEATEAPVAEEQAEAPAEQAEGAEEQTVVPAENAEEPVLLASVNGDELWSNNEKMQSLINSVVSYYASFGYDTTDPSMMAVAKSYGLEWAIDGILYDQKARELGVTAMTEEQQAALEAEAKAEWDEILNYYMQNVGGMTDSSTDEEKAQAKETALAYIQQNYGYTEESFTSEYTQSSQESQLRKNVQTAVLGEITATDDEVTGYFNELVEEDKGNYEGNIPMYEYYTNYMGEKSYYVPEGYRGVTHILLNVDSELMNAYTSLAAKLEEQQDKEAANTDAEDTAEQPADGAEETPATAEETPATAEETPAAAEPTAEPEEPVTQEMVDAAKKAILDSVQDQVKEIMAKYEAGTPFEDLITEYGKDPGMQQEANRTNGYAVHKESILWDPAFTEGAMSLQKIGDVSEPVLGTKGIHLIHYTRDIPAGAVELTEEIRTQLKEELLSEKENTAVSEMLEQWRAAAEIVYTEEGQAILDAAKEAGSESVETTEATEETLTDGE